MTASLLLAALRAGAAGLYTLEAATGLIIAHASWLAREDFTRFIHVGTSISDPGTELASIDWEAAIRALDAWRHEGLLASCRRDLRLRLDSSGSSWTIAIAAAPATPKAMPEMKAAWF
jgi:hypothetical protein